MASYRKMYKKRTPTTLQANRKQSLPRPILKNVDPFLWTSQLTSRLPRKKSNCTLLVRAALSPLSRSLSAYYATFLECVVLVQSAIRSTERDEGPLVRPLQLVSLTAAALWLASPVVRTLPGSGIVLLLVALLFAILANYAKKLPQKRLFAQPLGVDYSSGHPLVIRWALNIFQHLRGAAYFIVFSAYFSVEHLFLALLQGAMFTLYRLTLSSRVLGGDWDSIRQQLLNLQHSAANLQEAYPLLRHPDALVANTPLVFLMLVVAGCCAYGISRLTDKKFPLLSVGGWFLVLLLFISLCVQFATLNVEFSIVYEVPLCLAPIQTQFTVPSFRSCRLHGEIALARLKSKQRARKYDANKLVFTGGVWSTEQPSVPQADKATFLSTAFLAQISYIVGFLFLSSTYHHSTPAVRQCIIATTQSLSHRSDSVSLRWVALGLLSVYLCFYLLNPRVEFSIVPETELFYLAFIRSARAAGSSWSSRNVRTLHYTAFCNSKGGSNRSSAPTGRTLKKKRTSPIKKWDRSHPRVIKNLWASRYKSTPPAQRAVVQPNLSGTPTPPDDLDGSDDIEEEEKNDGDAEEELQSEEADPTEGEILKFRLNDRHIDLEASLVERAIPTIHALVRLRETAYWEDFVSRMERPPEEFESLEAETHYCVIRDYALLLNDFPADAIIDLINTDPHFYTNLIDGVFAEKRALVDALVAAETDGETPPEVVANFLVFVRQAVTAPAAPKLPPVVYYWGSTLRTLAEVIFPSMVGLGLARLPQSGESPLSLSREIILDDLSLVEFFLSSV